MADYLMQARDSVAGTMHIWTAATPDWAGSGFTGPNTAVASTIAIVGVVAEAGGGGAAASVTYDAAGNVVATGANVQAALDQIDAKLDGGLSSANIAIEAVGSGELADEAVLLRHVANGGRFVMPDVVGPRYAQYVCPVVQKASYEANEATEVDTAITVPNGMRGVCLAHVQVTKEDGTIHESAWKVPFSNSNPIDVGSPILIDAYESASAGAAPSPVSAIDSAVYSVSAAVATGRILKVTVTSNSVSPAVNIVSAALALELWVPDDPYVAP